MPLLLVSFLASLLAVTADDSGLLDQLIVSSDVANSFLTSGITFQSKCRQSSTRHRHRATGITFALGFFKLLTSPDIVVAERQDQGGNLPQELQEEINEKWYKNQWVEWGGGFGSNAQKEEGKEKCREVGNSLGKNWLEEGACEPIDEWDVSDITSFYHLFSQDGASTSEEKRSYIDVPSLNGWSTERVTSMDSTFLYAQRFNGQISNWNVARVTIMKKSECPFSLTSSSTLFIDTFYDCCLHLTNAVDERWLTYPLAFPLSCGNYVHLRARYCNEKCLNTLRILTNRSKIGMSEKS